MDYFELIDSNPDLFINNEFSNSGERIDFPLKIITDRKEISRWIRDKKSSLKKRGLPEEWGDIGVILHDPYIVVLRDLVKFPDGERRGYFRVLNRADLFGGQGVVILPVFNEKVVLLEIFRHATRQFHLELPRGFGEAGEKPDITAIRELEEEIGAEIIDIQDIGVVFANTGAESGLTKMFFAELRKISSPNISEGIKNFKLYEKKKIDELIENSMITDSFTLSVLLKAKLLKLI